MNLQLFSTTFVILVCSVYASTWTYKDQSTWPASCNASVKQQQSPINVEDNLKVNDTHFQNWFNFNVDGELSNNGHTLEFKITSAQPLVNYSSKSYKLEQLHFHWDKANATRGSEHQINGNYSLLECHFVHYDTQYASVGEAVASGVAGSLMVFAALFDLSSDNGVHSGLNVLLAGQDGTAPIPEGSVANQTGVRVDQILDIASQHNWFTYLGSLTTPDCNPIVRWFVSPTTQSLPQAQLDIFHAVVLSNGDTRNWRNEQVNFAAVKSAAFRTESYLAIIIAVMGVLLANNY